MSGIWANSCRVIPSRSVKNNESVEAPVRRTKLRRVSMVSSSVSTPSAPGDRCGPRRRRRRRQTVCLFPIAAKRTVRAHLVAKAGESFAATGFFTHEQTWRRQRRIRFGPRREGNCLDAALRFDDDSGTRAGARSFEDGRGVKRKLCKNCVRWARDRFTNASNRHVFCLSTKRGLPTRVTSCSTRPLCPKAGQRVNAGARPRPRVDNSAGAAEQTE